MECETTGKESESEVGTFLGGINVDTIGVGEKREDMLESIVKPFNQAITRLLQGLVSSDKDKNDYIISTSVLINGIKKLDPVMLIRRSYKHLIEEKIKEALIKKDLDFFLEKDYTYVIKKDRWEKLINFIITYVKTHADKLDEEEMTEIWDLIWVLLICSEYYDKYVKDYM